MKASIGMLSASHSQLEQTVNSKTGEITDVRRTIQEKSIQIKEIHADWNTLKEDIYFQQSGSVTLKIGVGAEIL